MINTKDVSDRSGSVIDCSHLNERIFTKTFSMDFTTK